MLSTNKKQQTSSIEGKNQNNDGETSKNKWDQIRKEWLGKNNGKLNQFAQSKPVSDEYRDVICEVIKSVKPPYPTFNQRISLEEMVDILLEVWEDDDEL